MADIVVLNAIVIASLFLWPWANVRRAMPRLEPGPGIRLAELNAYESQYRRSYAIRMSMLGLAGLVLVYGLVRLRSDEVLGSAPFPVIAASAIGALLVSMVGANVYRYFLDKRFVDLHPELADSLLPLMARLVVVTGPALAFAIIGGALLFERGTIIFLFEGLALLVIVASRKLHERSMMQKRLLVDPESPFGKRVADLTGRFGYVPKRIVLLQSLVANAGAYYNGVVMVTSALRLILTDDQILAILAHEVAHLQQKRMRKLKFARAIPIFALVLVGGGLVPLVATSPSWSGLLLPVLASGMMMGATIGSILRNRILQTLEGTSDLEPARLGYGPDLAEALTRLHRYQGVPSRWIGLDNLLLTHPSLEKRLAEIASASANAPEK